MTRVLRILVLLASVTAIVGVTTLGVRTALSTRPASPVEAEVLSLSSRLSLTRPLYEEPSQASPASVMPGLPIAALIFLDTFGQHLGLLRLLALITLLGVAGIVASVVHVETGSWALAVAAPGLLLAGFVTLGGQPGIAGPEPLMLALVMAGFLSLRSIPGAWGAMIAGLMLSVACFTQQQAVGFAAAGLVYLVIEGRRRAGAFALVLGVVGGGGYAVLSRLLGPWFNFYAWDVPLRSLQFAPGRILDYLGGDLLGTLGALMLAALLGLALPSRPWRGPGGLWVCLSAAALVAGLVATQRTAGAPDATLTTVTALALIGTMALKFVTGHLAAWPGSTRLNDESVLFVALALQFVALLARLSPERLLGGV